MPFNKLHHSQHYNRTQAKVSAINLFDAVNQKSNSHSEGAWYLEEGKNETTRQSFKTEPLTTLNKAKSLLDEKWVKMLIIDNKIGKITEIDNF